MATTKTTRRKCVVREGRFIDGCDALENCWDGPGTRGKGVRFVALTHIPTGKPSRTLAVLHSGEYVKRGIAMNFCPFCGVDLSGPHEPPQVIAGVAGTPSDGVPERVTSPDSKGNGGRDG